jgi:hypothetical protein
MEIIINMISKVRQNFRRKGPDMNRIFNDKIKRRITFMTPVITNAIETRAKGIIREVICETIGKLVYEEKVHNTCKMLRYLTTKLVNGPIQNEAKAEVLSKYWN